MITVLQVKGTDRFNVIGIDAGQFILQGNLTKYQLKELIREAKAALKK